MTNVAGELTLRERKKQRTRAHIAETARRLFADRGFDRVTVTEVAREAEVAPATVFNYFPTKEDLFYSGLEAFEEELLAAVRDRAPGESALTAFGRFVTTPRGLLAAKDPEAVERLAGFTRVITQSPALLARERQIYEGYTAALAALLADEAGARPGDVAPWAAANAMLGVHRALVEYSRARIAEGARNPGLLRDVRAQGRRALAL